jgi:chromosome segregation ATPase
VAEDGPERDEELGAALRQLPVPPPRADFYITLQARLEADVDLREEKLERWQAELTDLEERLAKKESELAAYVAQVQGALTSKRTAAG